MTDVMMRPPRQGPGKWQEKVAEHDDSGRIQPTVVLETSAISSMSKDVIAANLIDGRAARARTAARNIVLAAGLTALASLSLGFGAAAQDGSGWSKGALTTPPMPPARPSNLSAPAPPPPVPPLANGPPPGVNPMVADFAADMPQTLPAASRAQMQECGREWQKMKASGAAAEKTWLSFASVCLAR